MACVNPLVGLAADRYAGPAPTVIFDDPRSYVRRSGRTYDVVTLALTTPYRPIRSGAYSLGEDYAYTVEAFRDILDVLSRQNERPHDLTVAERNFSGNPCLRFCASGIVRRTHADQTVDCNRWPPDGSGRHT